MVSLMEHLLKPLASQIFDILGAFLCVVIHLSTCPLLFCFIFTWLILYPGAHFTWTIFKLICLIRFKTQRPGSKISFYDSNDNFFSLFVYCAAILKVLLPELFYLLIINFHKLKAAIHFFFFLSFRYTAQWLGTYIIYEAIL